MSVRDLSDGPGWGASANDRLRRAAGEAARAEPVMSRVLMMASFFICLLGG